jgi:hypothetical protein
LSRTPGRLRIRPYGDSRAAPAVTVDAHTIASDSATGSIAVPQLSVVHGELHPLPGQQPTRVDPHWSQRSPSCANPAVPRHPKPRDAAWRILTRQVTRQHRSLITRTDTHARSTDHARHMAPVDPAEAGRPETHAFLAHTVPEPTPREGRGRPYTRRTTADHPQLSPVMQLSRQTPCWTVHATPTSRDHVRYALVATSRRSTVSCHAKERITADTPRPYGDKTRTRRESSCAGHSEE